MGKIIPFVYKVGEKKMCTFIEKLRNAGAKNETEIKERAKEFLEHYGVNFDEEIIDISRIIYEMGFYVCQMAMDEDMDAFIIVDTDLIEKYKTPKVICLNKDNSVGTKRFLLAHELAHYIFEYKEREQARYYNTYNKKEESISETRANLFAANILVPEDVFKRKYAEYMEETESKPVTIQKLAEFFNVSTKCIEYRMEEVK